MTRTIDEVRGYLRTQVNSAVRRLGMYGDELSLILLFEALAYAEGMRRRNHQAVCTPSRPITPCAAPAVA